MKHLAHIVFLFLICFQLHAINDSLRAKMKVHQYYCQIGIGGGNFAPVQHAALTYIHKSSWGISASYHFISYDSKNTPPDYQPGLYIGQKNKIPDDFQYVYSLLFVKEFNTSSPYFSWGIEAGPSLINLHRLSFNPNPYYTLLKSNYLTVDAKSSLAGFTFRPKFEFNISRYWGVEAAGVLHLNKEIFYAGAEFNFSIGILRMKLKDDKEHFIGN